MRGASDPRTAGRRLARAGVILADTSAWVEYDRATDSAVDQRLTDLIESRWPLVVPSRL